MSTQNQQQIQIGIVDDHNLFRKGLIKLINLGDKDNKYSILFEAGNGNELIEKIGNKTTPKPDIILMDIDMPDMDGFEAVSWLQKFHPSINVLVISMFEKEEKIVRMLKLKVKGYLSKDIKVEDMHKALEAIADKGFYYTDKVAEVMAKTIQNGDKTFQHGEDGQEATNPSVWAGLSENEIEFVKLACTEMTYQQIAEKMSLSVKTIEGYRENIFQKFKLKNRVSMAMFAVKHKLVDPQNMNFETLRN
jgi:two-component system, NarL family, invasion response regulator UvrY